MTSSHEPIVLDAHEERRVDTQRWSGHPRPTIRRALGSGDAMAIAELHARVYSAEYGMNKAFTESVAASVEAALESGWPGGGAVWLIDSERKGQLAGSLGLTREAEDRGRIRWFVLERQLRGRGLGRQLLDELLIEARAQSLSRIELETFSALATAARLYRTAGFRLLWSQQREDWGSTITYQHYELGL